ncbi:MAG: hypothetical protein JRD93_17290 [Deltaproteobacteria bacterium]|nr:hypothetical protein [Deltaproteobacteria bacterium]
MSPKRTLDENPLEGNCVLPGGFYKNGACFSDVKLHPPTGRVEELLGAASNSRFLAPVITTLLAYCIERIGPITEITPEIVRNLLVGDRDYLVLKLRQMTIGDRVEATLVCPNTHCGKKIDIDFDLRQIPIKQGKVSSQVFAVTVPGQEAFEDNDGDKHYRVEFCLPRGGDQEELAPLAVNNEPEAVNKLLAHCIQRIDGVMEIDESQIEKLSPSAREKIEKTMAELAPQVDLEMEAKCPECGKTFSFPFNMSQFFIDEMKGNLNQLYQEVHFLAFYYKWSESDILSMTRKKRRNYLELLNEHVERRKRGYA